MKVFTINLQTNMFIYKQFITLFTCLQIIYKLCTLSLIKEASKNIDGGVLHLCCFIPWQRGYDRGTGFSIIIQ